MALFAMLAVLTSPALAFACCCHDAGAKRAPVQPALPVASPTSAAPSHPGCHGHGEATKAAVPRAQSVTFDAEVGPVNSTDGPCLRDICSCAHGENSPAAIVEPQNSSAFSPLVLSGAVKAYALASIVSPSLRFAFASGVAKPRSPSHTDRSGRAPPVFSP